MRQLKYLPKSLIMFTLLMGSFLTAKSAQAGLSVVEASIRTSLPRNVLNYNGSIACFGHHDHGRGFSEIFIGKIIDRYCNYPMSGREERASNYKVIIPQKNSYWIDTSNINRYNLMLSSISAIVIGSRTTKGVCGVNYRSEYHVGELSAGRGSYTCRIGYGGSIVVFDEREFYIAFYEKGL